MTAFNIAFKLLFWLTFIALTATGVVIVEILALWHAKLNTSDKESIRMLDGMHEGLIILKKR